MNLSRAAKAVRVSDAVAAGTSDVQSASVDTVGFDAVEFTVAMGAITAGAVTSVKAQGSTDDTVWSDLVGATVTVADDDDNQVFIVDVAFPRHQYVRCVVDRGTQNAVVDSIVARLYLPKEEPVTHDTTTVGGSVFVNAPAEVTP